MPDQNKRRTLKIMGVTPLVATPVFASAAGLRFYNGVPDLPPATQKTGMPLQIQILDTTAVPDNNVIIRNNSDETLLVSRFMPGHIYFNDQIMDLNEAIGNRPLSLQAGQSKAFDFKIWPVLNAGPVEYVWADHAVDVLSDNMSVVTLGAFMAGTNAVVYADTRTAIAS